VFFTAAKETFFVMTVPTQISAFEGGKMGVRNGQFLPAPKALNRKIGKNRGKAKNAPNG
jgi:hypothetical protein